MPKMSANGGLCDSGNGLQAPDFANCGPESPKVSSPTPKYSRFWETAAGDRVRSTLPDRVCSATRQILRSALRSQIPELNPVENIWQYMRDNWLSNRVFKSYDDSRGVDIRRLA
jgi:hypothetical protein